MEFRQPPGGKLLASFLASHFMARRLEDRIRRLCAEAVAAKDAADANAVLQQLSSALHEHVQRLRSNIVTPAPFFPERRQSRS
jgi:hypothetical protein